MDCGYLFLIKDRKKILKKLEKNEKIYIDKQNNYYSLCKVSKEPNFVHCRRHLNLIEREIEFVNELREISIDDFTNVSVEKKNVRYTILVSEEIKLKAEKILKILKEQKEKKEQPIEIKRPNIIQQPKSKFSDIISDIELKTQKKIRSSKKSNIESENSKNNSVKKSFTKSKLLKKSNKESDKESDKESEKESEESEKESEELEELEEFEKEFEEEEFEEEEID